MGFFSKIRRRSATEPSAVYGSSDHTGIQKTRRLRFDPQPTFSQASLESVPRSVFINTPSDSSDVPFPPEYATADGSRYQRPLVPASVGSQTPGKHTETEVREMAGYSDENLNYLAPMLAVESVTILWDVRGSPAHIRKPRSHQATDLTAPATSMESQHIRLISYDFPWSIDVTRDRRPLTVMDVIEALYENLDKEVRPSEWALATDSQKYAMQKANRNRRQSETAKRIRRVDWLGSRTMFRGLEHDENLIRKRLMPGDVQLGETWVVRFGSQWQH